MTDVKRVHMKILVSITTEDENITPGWFETILADVEKCFTEAEEPRASLKGFDIEHMRRR